MSAREKLLEAAASLAVQDGVTALGVERVVKAAGLSKGAFFYHFATKEDMIRGLLDHVATACMSSIEEAVASGSRFTEALAETVIHDAQHNGALVHVLVASVAIDPTLRETLTLRAKEWRIRMIEEDGVSEADADLVRIAMDGLMIASVLYDRDNPDCDPTHAAEALRSLVASLWADEE